VLWNAPSAQNRETIDYLLFRIHSPTNKETSNFTFFDELGNINIFWANTFVSHSILASKAITGNDIDKLVQIARNEFLSPAAKAGMLTAFSKIKDSDLAVSHLENLYEFADSKSSSVAISALYSIAKIIENNKTIVDKSILDTYVKKLEDIIKYPMLKGTFGRNESDKSFSMMFEIEAHNIQELITSELYKVYLGKYAVGNRE
jgi:hypothetical protein